MKSVNQVTLVGNLVKEPDFRQTPRGRSVVSLTIATTNEWRDKESQEKKESTDYHRVILWGKSAEIVNQYAKSGTKMMVQGKLKTRSYDDKEGVKRYVTEVIGNDFMIFSSGDGGKNKPEESSGNESLEVDDISF
jgi:single-strand DNA-binding protein